VSDVRAAAAALPTVLVCTACGERLHDDAPLAFACPAAHPGDDVDHVLVRVLTPPIGSFAEDRDAANPYLRWRTRFHAYHRARALGWSDSDYVRLVARLDDAVAVTDGRGFRVTPFTRSGPLSDALGFSAAGGVWVKDETGNVSGSHKARHLFGLCLELEVEDARGAATGPSPPSRARPHLAVASCGNAALAAAVAARAVDRRLDVFIPPDADPVLVGRLNDLGAVCSVCQREPGQAGDPTYRALLDAIDAGAIPFTCQGNLNGLAIEGGETLGWEIAAAVGTPQGPARLDRVVVQVGGGALLSAVIAGLRDSAAVRPRIHAVQPASVHPLVRAFEAVRVRVAAGEPAEQVLADAAHHRSAFMWPWETEPHSVAHGITDDETYDWRACVRGMLASGGSPVVVSESALEEANALATAATGVDVDHTGSAGLAGLARLVRTRAVHPDEVVAVLFTGAVRRPSTPAPGDDPLTRAAHQRRTADHATSGDT